MTPRGSNPQRRASASTPVRSTPSSSSRNRLNKGAKNLGQAQPTRRVKTDQAAQAEPPARAGARHQPEQQRDQRHQECDPEREALDEVDREETRRRSIEAESRLDPERAPDIERQARQHRQQYHGRDDRDLALQTLEPGGRNRCIDRSEAPCKSQDAENCRSGRELE